MSWRTSGRRVTIPEPLGRLDKLSVCAFCDFGYLEPGPYKSLPTMFSSTELFPLDCEPTTTICGRSIGFCTCVRIVRRMLRGMNADWPGAP